VWLRIRMRKLRALRAVECVESLLDCGEGSKTAILAGNTESSKGI
jgi:hypothetical protein